MEKKTYRTSLPQIRYRRLSLQKKDNQIRSNQRENCVLLAKWKWNEQLIRKYVPKCWLILLTILFYFLPAGAISDLFCPLPSPRFQYTALRLCRSFQFLFFFFLEKSKKIKTIRQKLLHFCFSLSLNHVISPPLYRVVSGMCPLGFPDYFMATFLSLLPVRRYRFVS